MVSPPCARRQIGGFAGILPWVLLDRMLSPDTVGNQAPMIAFARVQPTQPPRGTWFFQSGKSLASGSAMLILRAMPL